MEKKLLVVCGATATGKTGLALQLAEKFNGELVSADSRQVYRGMDIGTGKDRDVVGTIAGYDLVEPTDDFSVGQYIPIARKIIGDIWKRGKLPILVGGSGLYLKGVVDGIETADIGRDDELRKNLEGKEVVELFEILETDDPARAVAMNEDDRKNPRRLVRAIEVAGAKSKTLRLKRKTFMADSLWVGLEVEKEELGKRIEDRVEKRLEQGFEKEVKDLLRRGVVWEDQAMQALGYKQYREYYEGKMDREEFVRRWKTGERKYARRQMRWFGKNEKINWFNVKESKYREKLEKLVKKWHNMQDAKEN